MHDRFLIRSSHHKQSASNRVGLRSVTSFFRALRARSGVPDLATFRNSVAVGGVSSLQYFIQGVTN
jgi:hypothetical protein